MEEILQPYNSKYQGGNWFKAPKVNLMPINLPRQIKADTLRLGKGIAPASLTSILSLPASIGMHKDAYKYYSDMAKNKSLPGEQRQLANAFKTRELINMITEGIGSPIGSAIGALGTKGSKRGAMVGAGLPVAMSAGVGKAFDIGLADAVAKYNFEKYKKNNTAKVDSESAQPSQQSTQNNQVASMQKQSAQPVVANNTIGQILSNIPQQELQSIAEQQVGNQVSTDMDELMKSYMDRYLQAIQPQVEALQTYKRRLPWANISDALIRGGLASYAQAYDIPGLANAYTGSEYTNRLAKNYDIDQALANIPMGAMNAQNTLLGNMAVAQQMGMDPAVALADKDIQKVLTAYNTAGSRENVANIYANARMYDSILDNATARAIAQGKMGTALQIQQLRNYGNMRNALINAGSFGANPADVQALLSLYGYSPVGLTEEGTLANQQTKVPITNDKQLTDDKVVGTSFLGNMR